jgi:putative glutathione S-transferase
MMINLKGLQDCFDISVVHPTWQRTRPDSAEDTHCGWTFGNSDEPTSGLISEAES